MVYSNIFYIPKIKRISGITTWILEVVKKYKNLDITVIYNDPNSDREQINRLKQYVRVKRLGEDIQECNKIFITYGGEKDLKYFKYNKSIGIIHTNYVIYNLHPFKNVDEVIAVSEEASRSYEELTGIKPKVCYNPLNIDNGRTLKLVSATRMSDKKGTYRMVQLIKEFEKNQIPFLWIILSDEELGYRSDNIIYIKPRLDARGIISTADYLVQLSDEGDVYNYSINEALTMGVPIISTKLNVFKELGIKNKVHGYLLDFDMLEIPIEEIYKNIPKFEYKPPEDSYLDFLDIKPSTYKKENMIPLRCIKSYKDIEYNEHISVNSIIYTDDEKRAKMLVEKGLVEYENVEPNPNCKYKISVIIPVYNQEQLIIRTLDSIPVRNNVEIIVIDDKSTDNTYKVLLDYKKLHKDKDIRLLHNMDNKGVGYTYNRGLDEAKGDYIVRIDSDDYFYPGQFNKIVDNDLDGTDMVYYNLEDNNGRILEVNQRNRQGRCGAVKFIRREFIGNTRCPEIRTAEDRAFNDELLLKYPTEKFTKRVIYHYNYPRENSLTDLTKRGLL